jgi:hypothetical protein
MTSSIHAGEIIMISNASVLCNNRFILCVITSLLTTARRASVLSTHSDVPPVTKTTMSADLLHALDIITVLGSNVLCENLRVLSSLEILLPIQEPERNLELTRVLNDGNNLFDFISSQFSSTLVDIDFGLFADQVRETTSDTGDLGQSEDNVTLSFNVGIENTQNVLEFRSLHQRGRPVVESERDE